jgi:hypothetical protein
MNCAINWCYPLLIASFTRPILDKASTTESTKWQKLLDQVLAVDSDVDEVRPEAGVDPGEVVRRRMKSGE